jgi:hypothetical protein
MNFRDARLLPTIYILTLAITAFSLGQLSERSFHGDLFWLVVVLNSIVIAFLLFTLIRQVWKPAAKKP